MAGLKHTLGPWDYGIVDGDSAIYVVADGIRIARICEWNEVEHHGMPDLVNAPLIAAAPELLAACEAAEELAEHITTCRGCLSYYGQGLCDTGISLWSRTKRLNQAALAKARGED